VLGAAVLIAAMLVALRLETPARVPTAEMFRRGLVMAAALVALWIVRRGGEMRRTVEVGERGLSFAGGAQPVELRYDEIETLRYVAPFGASRDWLPALALHDRAGRVFRVPAFVERGERLVERILECADRDDLRAWADAQKLGPRMGATRRRLVAGYALCGSVVVAAAVYYLY